MKRNLKINDICTFLETNYPLSLSSDFDLGKVGLTFGSRKLDFTGCLLSLDLNIDVVKDAIEKGCNLIITHHPYIFRPITQIKYDTELAEVIKLMLVNNISLYSMHTCYDVCENGVNDCLSNMLGLTDIKHECDDICVNSLMRYGKCDLTFKELINKVKEIFELDSVRYVGELDKPIKRVGIVGGSGGHERDVNNAIRYGLDCYISGEFTLSSGQIAKSNDICIIEVPHGIEKFSLYPLKEELSKQFDKPFIVTNINTDPFKTI